MRTLVTCLGIGMLLLSACGSGSKDEKGGAAGAAGGGAAGAAGGGAAGAAGSGGGTTITPQGNCANLTCLNDLATLTNGCQPSGTCVQQQVGLSANICYSNGVKQSVTITSMSPMTMSMATKNASSVCYTVDMTETSLAFKNASGKTVATMSLTATATGGYTITCADGTTGTIDSTCGSDTSSATNVPTAGAASDCTPGTCTF